MVFTTARGRVSDAREVNLRGKRVYLLLRIGSYVIADSGEPVKNMKEMVRKGGRKARTIEYRRQPCEWLFDRDPCALRAIRVGKGRRRRCDETS